MFKKGGEKKNRQTTPKGPGEKREEKQQNKGSEASKHELGLEAGKTTREMNKNEIKQVCE